MGTSPEQSTEASLAPEREISFVDPDSDARGFLVIDTLRHGIVAGGLRVGPEVTLDEVRRLARTMSLKFRVHDFPVGGAKSGLRIPADATPEQRIGILQRFARSIESLLRTSYTIGTDLGSTNDDIATMYDAIGIHPMVATKQILRRSAMRSLVTSIPDFVVRRFPSYSPFGALLTAKGIVAALTTVLEVDGPSLRGLRVAIQGLGEIGRTVLQCLEPTGAVVVRVADARGGLFCDDGLNVNALLGCIDGRGLVDRDRLARHCSFEETPRDDWLLGDVDVLIPAATPDALHRDNRDRVRCRYIVEAANIAMDFETNESLHGRGIAIVPDFLANSGLTSSFGLMVANRVKPYFRSSIDKATLDCITGAVRRYHAQSRRSGSSIRALVDRETAGSG